MKEQFFLIFNLRGYSCLPKSNSMLLACIYKKHNELDSLIKINFSPFLRPTSTLKFSEK